MSKILKCGALLLALFSLLSLFAACDKGDVTNDRSPSLDGSSSAGETSLPESGLASPSDAPASPSFSKESESSDEQQLAVNKNNALEKLKAGYAATMSASALSLTGEISHYEAGAGKGDTVVYPISYLMSKNSEGTFGALLTTGHDGGSTAKYFSNEKTYVKQTDVSGENYTVTKEDAKVAPTVENTVMPVLNENLSIVSFENVFTRFCQANYDIEFKDGIYCLYFYGSYTEFARICLEDATYESFLNQKVEETFPTNTGFIEFYLTEDGYYAGMKTGSELTSETRSMKMSLNYTFANFGKTVLVEEPAWISEAK